jgi:hypothetical protein
LGGIQTAQRRRKRIAVFATRLSDFSREILSDLRNFDITAPFGDKPWNVWARADEPAFV